MGSKFTTSIGLALVSVFLLSGMGRKNADLSRNPNFSHLIGTQYKTQTELVMHKDDRSKHFTLSPYGGGRVPEKDDMKEKFPFRFYATRIFGVLPPNSIFKIIKIKEEGSSTLHFTSYYGEIVESSNSEFVGKEVQTTFLAELRPPLKYKPELVLPIK